MKKKMKKVRKQAAGAAHKAPSSAALQHKALKRAEHLRLTIMNKNKKGTDSKTDAMAARAAIANDAIRQIYDIVSGKDAAHFTHAINKVVRNTETKENEATREKEFEDAKKK